MADIKKVPHGIYTYRELLHLAGVNFDEQATVDYGAGEQVDFRRVTVGGLGFSDLDDVLVVPDTAGVLEVRTEGKLVGKVSVDGDADARHSSELPDTARFPQQPA